MTQVPQKPLVPDNTLITKTPEEGRAFVVIRFARNPIHAMQGELETLKACRAQYAYDPYGLIAASHVQKWLSLRPSQRPIIIGANSFFGTRPSPHCGTKQTRQQLRQMSASAGHRKPFEAHRVIRPTTQHHDAGQER